MRKKLTPLAALVAALSLVLVLAGCSQQGSGSTSNSGDATASEATNAQEISFTLKVDAGQANKGMLYDKTDTAKAGTTVYEALVNTGLELKVDTSSGSVYVDGIGGVIASQTSPNAGWLFSVNGEQPNQGASDVKIANGDEVVWKFVSDFTTTQ